MRAIIKKEICDRCGELAYRRSINITNLHKYDTSSKTAYINSLSKLENVSLEIAKSWAEHGLFESCLLKKRNCPACKFELKTWQAKMCLNCGSEFEAWSSSNVNT